VDKQQGYGDAIVFICALLIALTVAFFRMNLL